MRGLRGVPPDDAASCRKVRLGEMKHGHGHVDMNMICDLGMVASEGCVACTAVRALTLNKCQPAAVWGAHMHYFVHYSC